MSRHERFGGVRPEVATDACSPLMSATRCSDGCSIVLPGPERRGRRRGCSHQAGQIRRMGAGGGIAAKPDCPSQHAGKLTAVLWMLLKVRTTCRQRVTIRARPGIRDPVALISFPSSRRWRRTHGGTHHRTDTRADVTSSRRRRCRFASTPQPQFDPLGAVAASRRRAAEALAAYGARTCIAFTVPSRTSAEASMPRDRRRERAEAAGSPIRTTAASTSGAMIRVVRAAQRAGQGDRRACSG